MGYAKHVGRVGALAVALGIGAAVATTPGVAWADGTEDTHVSDAGGTNPESPDATSPTERQDPGEAIRKGIERTADNLRKVVTGVVQSSGRDHLDAPNRFGVAGWQANSRDSQGEGSAAAQR